MSKTSHALDLASDVYSMAIFEEDNVLKLTEEPGSFYYWAIQEHVAYAINEIGCDRDTFKTILDDYIDYQDTINAAENVRDNHLEIATAMFRYYLQAYRRRVAK
jgi:hypothetical protein